MILQLSGEMDEQMTVIDHLLCDDKLLELMSADFSKRYPLSSLTGRKSTPVEVIFRMLALKHLRGLSYENTIKNVKESLILRQFCRVYFNPLPNKSTLIRWANTLSEQTLEKMNQRLTQIATHLQITKGTKIRTDGTVVATNIHFPSDNSLLGDGVKVISRLLSQAKSIILATTKTINLQIFRNRYRTARRISRQIDSLSKTRNESGQQKRKQAYIKLIEITKAAMKQAQKVKILLEKLDSAKSQRILQKCEIFLPRIEQVVEQAFRRVLNHEKVSAAEKIVSIFEVHTDIICRGKPNLDVEFGRKVWLDEVDGGIVSNYRVLKGNPHDTQQLVSSLDQHLENFGYPPKLVSSDRGVYSQSHENYAQTLGIKEVILPQGGYRSKQRIQHERKRNFIKGRYWHNGVEGRISFLKRCFGFQRCLYRGDIGFQRWVGWGIIAHNLTIISRCLIS
ncbi:ISNCY family transposase [Dendronalium sp. ChiSLP03b]|uniref:ISNCY family transposase n=1 Tax=Dendronalium sp. ChiSLP03b TaxID=3075381 RepID=UPI002AD24F9E|nr:ISNCY family transposase [Dendronalium sp. ChiSLP03b]MDZ8204682.1 ISNCY family transposase [Dendronalium sp. ChiSLP03b]